MPPPLKTTSLYDEAAAALDAIFRDYMSRNPGRDRMAAENGIMRAIITAWAAQPSRFPNCLETLKNQIQ